MSKGVLVTGAVLSWLMIAAVTPASAQFWPLPPPPPPPPILSKLDPLVQLRLLVPAGHSRVIVRSVNAGSVGVVAVLIQLAGGTLGRTLPSFQAQVADVPNAALAALSNLSLIRRIALDRLILGANDRTAATVGATAVRQAYGYDGTGVGVAVIDSGVTPWHDDLADPAVAGSQRVDQFVDFVNAQSAPYDDYGHGTHVAGIIAGNGFDSGGMRAGIAPAAHLVVLKVLDGTGHGHISDVISAFEYVVDHKDLFHIRVVNLSVGAGVFESCNTDLLTLAAKRAVDAGIVVVAAAGNLGRDSQGQAQYGGIQAPGNAPWVLTVGASSHMGTIDRSDDTMAAFSSRGPTAIDYLAKPDVVAPGVGTESLSSPNSFLYGSMSSYLLSGTVDTPYLPYLSLSGTSQATPVVAGTVALMLQANPALTPNAVKAILQFTAQTYAGYDPLTQGAGFLNAQGAITLTQFLSSPPGTAYSADPAWSRQLIWGNHSVEGGRLDSITSSAWGVGVAWGAVKTPAGQNVQWGVVCATADCSGLAGTAGPWGTTCVDGGCNTVVWGDATSQNVVWGSSCGGADCPSATPWSADNNGVVWGSTDSGDAVVWGSSDDGDAVVWGSSCGASGCPPVIWPR